MYKSYPYFLKEEDKEMRSIMGSIVGVISKMYDSYFALHFSRCYTYAYNHLL